MGQDDQQQASAATDLGEQDANQPAQQQAEPIPAAVVPPDEQLEQAEADQNVGQASNEAEVARQEVGAPAATTEHDIDPENHRCRNCRAAEWWCLEGNPCEPRDPALAAVEEVAREQTDGESA